MLLSMNILCPEIQKVTTEPHLKAKLELIKIDSKLQGLSNQHQGLESLNRTMLDLKPRTEEEQVWHTSLVIKASRSQKLKVQILQQLEYQQAQLLQNLICIYLAYYKAKFHPPTPSMEYKAISS